MADAPKSRRPDDLRTLEDPVSTQVTRVVPAAKAAQFERLLEDVISAARGFAGHLGVDVLRPPAGGTYQVIFRYRTQAEHDAWMQSAQRRSLVARIDDFLGDPGGGTVRTVDGWEGWFVAPDYAPPAPPRRWKMALVTLATIYPVVLVLLVVLSPLTANLAQPLGMLLTMVVTIPLMTWVIMPAVTTRLGEWLRQ